MAKLIISTPKANQEIKDINEFLIKNWSVDVANDFANRLEKIFNIIATTPELYPLSEVGNDVRKCVVTKHNTLYFKEFEEVIYIISVFDNRQSPNKLNQFLT